MKEVCLEIEKRYEMKFIEIGTDIEMAKKLLAMGLSIEQVSQSSGLSVGELKKMIYWVRTY